MEVDRSVVAALLGACFGVGCGLAGPTGREVDGPGPHDSPLEVTSVAPDSDRIAPEASLRIRFDAYLDDESFRSFDTGTLTAGGRRWAGWADYRMVDRSIVWTPRSSVPTKLDVQLTLSENLRSVTGSKLTDRRQIAEWQIDEGGASARGAESQRDGATWAEVRGIFDRRCGDCHAESDRLPPLTHEGLVGVTSTEVDRKLVRPYDPADSYLMHKILWNYPDRRFSPQPPPWDGGQELDRPAQRTIEAWIAAGAPGEGGE